MRRRNSGGSFDPNKPRRRRGIRNVAEKMTDDNGTMLRLGQEAVVAHCKGQLWTRTTFGKRAYFTDIISIGDTEEEEEEEEEEEQQQLQQQQQKHQQQEEEQQQQEDQQEDEQQQEEEEEEEDCYVAIVRKDDPEETEENSNFANILMRVHKRGSAIENLELGMYIFDMDSKFSHDMTPIFNPG